jgi:hypothetical protein
MQDYGKSTLFNLRRERRKFASKEYIHTPDISNVHSIAPNDSTPDVGLVGLRD